MNDRIQPALRIPAIDFARGVALVAMAIFHFGWDLENFGLTRAAMTLEPQWKYFARAIAASFLMLVGVSTWLAKNNGLNVKSFIKRIAMVGGAAMIITIATYFATPQGFIFFGILHNITLSSLLILLFMPLPVFILVPAAIFTLTAHMWLRSPMFDDAVWWWSGLSQIIPKANDYVPMFPWFGWVIMGLALAKILARVHLWATMAEFDFGGPPSRLLRFFGQHSLIFYLVHQPIMIGLIYLYTKLIAGI